MRPSQRYPFLQHVCSILIQITNGCCRYELPISRFSVLVQDTRQSTHLYPVPMKTGYWIHIWNNVLFGFVANARDFTILDNFRKRDYFFPLKAITQRTLSKYDVWCIRLFYSWNLCKNIHTISTVPSWVVIYHTRALYSLPCSAMLMTFYFLRFGTQQQQHH